MGITHRAVSPAILLTFVVGLTLSLRAQEPARSVREQHQYWTRRALQIRAGEGDEARKVYENARAVYRQRLAEVEQ